MLKITFMGAGSTVFVRNVLGDCMRTPALWDAEMALYDIDAGRLDEHKLGELFYFFQLSCGISAYTLGVNPFNQPGVEHYKANMFRLLGKPGYE